MREGDIISCPIVVCRILDSKGVDICAKGKLKAGGTADLYISVPEFFPIRHDPEYTIDGQRTPMDWSFI
jgi:hypothetical protein